MNPAMFSLQSTQSRASNSNAGVREDRIIASLAPLDEQTQGFPLRAMGITIDPSPSEKEGGQHFVLHHM